MKDYFIYQKVDCESFRVRSTKLETWLRSGPQNDAKIAGEFSDSNAFIHALEDGFQKLLTMKSNLIFDQVTTNDIFLQGNSLEPKVCLKIYKIDSSSLGEIGHSGI